MPELVPEAFSDSDLGNETDDETAFTYPPGMTELTCRLCLPCRSKSQSCRLICTCAAQLLLSSCTQKAWLLLRLSLCKSETSRLSQRMNGLWHGVS